MKYYCPDCESEIKIGKDYEPLFSESWDVHCPLCESNGENMKRIPDFETPAQYEKRIGKKWNGAVWIRHNGEYCATGLNNTTAKILEHSYGVILCANTSESPPDNYVPEEGE